MEAVNQPGEHDVISVNERSSEFHLAEREFGDSIEVRFAGSEVVDRFNLASTEMELRRVDIPASALGAAETVDLTISVDQTFVPASVPALESNDSRELGVRVFWAFVQPS